MIGAKPKTKEKAVLRKMRDELCSVTLPSNFLLVPSRKKLGTLDFQSDTKIYRKQIIVTFLGEERRKGKQELL